MNVAIIKVQAEEEIDLKPTWDIVEKYRTKHGGLIGILQEIQEEYGYVPKVSVELVADELGLYSSHIYGVLTFYAQFHLTPRGKYIVRACRGTACHVKGATQIIDAVKGALNLSGVGTTEDKMFTFEEVACIGCCALAPCVMISDDVYAKLTPGKIKEIISEIRSKELN